MPKDCLKKLAYRGKCSRVDLRSRNWQYAGQESREILLRILNAHYDRFVVVAGDNFLKKIRKLADGSIFQQKKLRSELVDHVGYLEDALLAAQMRTGASSATVVAYQRRVPSTIFEAVPGQPCSCLIH